MTDQPTCNICGEPMPEGEEMFKFHGYSGPCPKPPLPKNPESNWSAICGDLTQLLLRATRHLPADNKDRVQALDYIERKNLASPLRQEPL